MRPVDVSEGNSLEIYYRLKREKSPQKPRYAVRDAVRIAKN